MTQVLKFLFSECFRLFREQNSNLIAVQQTIEET